jgi:uncharacterized hydrophobic protein (TIGR00341 family)
VKVIEVIADAGHEDTIRGIAEQHGAEDCWIGAEDADGRRAMRLLVAPGNRQAVLDALQSTLGTSENWHLLITPTEAVLPKAVEEKDKEKENGEKKSRKGGLSREELYNVVERNARLDNNYLALVCLSTIVVAIGLIADNIAVVIGAMVIAPLLGPNIALALGTALGDTPLMWQSLRTALAGLGLALVLCIAIGYFSPFETGSIELMSRTRVGPEAILLALASGAAAVISLTSGYSTVLVGVMVAVALLPPTAALGLMLGKADWSHAYGAALLLAVNIVSINLVAKLAFRFAGIKPRTWLEQRKAQQSMTAYILGWAIALGLLVIAVVLYQQHTL